MLGQFLEFSLTASPLAPAFDFYCALGFQSLPAGDLLGDRYVALSNGRIAVGLHDREDATPRLTFVRPQLRDYARAIRRLGIELDYAHLADDEFHRLGFTDPDGHSVGMIEARTFGPGASDAHSVSVCGEFLEYSLPVTSVEVSGTFWSALGFEAVASGESPHPWVRIAGRGLVLGLHEARFAPGLSFRCDQLEARLEYLRAKSLAPKSGNPLGTSKRGSATLVAPEGTVLYLLDPAAETQG
jgi:hypothetical protein